MQALLNRMSSLVTQKLPGDWKERVGSDVYHKFQRMRVRQLKGEVKIFGKERPIEYFISEHGKANRLLFLPGFADSKENFYTAAQFLMKDFDIVVPDLPGFGRSFRDESLDYKLDHYAEWISDFVDHIGWTDFHLVGNSLGGSVAVELALRMPERVKTLTLADCGGVVFRDQKSIYQEFIDGHVIFNMRTPAEFNYFLQRVFHKPPVIPPLVWNYLYQEYSKHGPFYQKVLSDLIHGITSFDDPILKDVILNDKIQHLSMPTFIIWGDQDTFFPVSTAPYMQSQIPGSKMFIMEGCGHGPHAESPLKFARLVRKFIQEVN